MSAGTLHVLATPIGNLGDLTDRAKLALSQATLVVAEDTRRTRVLLSHLGLSHVSLQRLDAHASAAEIARVAEQALAGAQVVLATDAGTPSVSDPGAALVAAARALGVPVVPLPGPSAVTAALSVCGYTFSAFRFVGFLPRSGLDRARAVADLASTKDVVILFEAPSRLHKTLTDLAASTAERRALVARELTKKHEELIEGPLAELAQRFEGREVLGELTIVLAPFDTPKQATSDEQLEIEIDALLARGSRPRDVAEQLALESGRPKREVYALVLARRQRRP